MRIILTDRYVQLNEVIRLEVNRERLRLWTPIGRFLSNLRWSKYDVSDNTVHDDDDDPGESPNALSELTPSFLIIL
jgi:hypothetical protein